MSTLDQSQVAGSTLGYAQITGSVTTASSTAVQITGLSVTVTIPAGGRRTRITFYARSHSNNTSATYNHVRIWDGAVGSGTQLQDYQGYVATASTFPSFGCMMWSGIVSAGTKTYNISYDTSGGTMTLEASSNMPAFILVELI